VPPSVARHLGIDVAEYDRRIRTFIPGYEDLLDAAANAFTLVNRRAPMTIDLGIGTGALADRCLRRQPDAKLLGIDADPEMLEAARRRLRRVPHATFVPGNFERVPLPAADACVASLSLHHVPTRRRKRSLYERIFAALSRGGVLVNADCAPAADRAAAEDQHAFWRAHMLKTYDRRAVDRYFGSWADEDVYIPLPVELAILDDAGFRPEVVWRRGPFVVIAARRPS
jgi:ubiquinone/menaquinone biosynthesis C-methylase UbiE